MTSLPPNSMCYYLTQQPGSGVVRIVFSDTVPEKAIDLIQSCMEENAFVGSDVTRADYPSAPGFNRRLSIFTTLPTPVLSSVRYLCQNAGIAEIEYQGKENV